MYSKQEGAIATQSCMPLKLVDQFTHLSCNISSTEKPVLSGRHDDDDDDDDDDDTNNNSLIFEQMSKQFDSYNLFLDKQKIHRKRA